MTWVTIRKTGQRAHKACVDAFNETMQCGIDRGHMCLDEACALHDQDEVMRRRRERQNAALNPIIRDLCTRIAWPHPLATSDGLGSDLILQFADQLAAQFPTL